MKLYFWESAVGNFGDDLNEWLWPRLFPGLWDPDDNITFVGVGTIIDDLVPRTVRRIVFGSGVGLRRLPPDFKDPSWQYYCVRGPLSAKVLQIPESVAITDSAILLRTFPEFVSKQKKGIVFVPHWITAQFGHWKECCRFADIEFLDPRLESRSVIKRIAGAELVLAESMHAAIIADAFRVPWQPLISKSHVAPFKWKDWCSSLEISYKPNLMPQLALSSNIKDWYENSFISSIFGKQLSSRIFKDRLKKINHLDYEDDSLIERYFKEQQMVTEEKKEPESTKKVSFMRGRMKILIRNAIDGKAFSFIDRRLKENAAKGLEELSKRTPFLSSDSAINRATERLLEKVEQLKSDYANGFRMSSLQ